MNSDFDHDGDQITMTPHDKALVEAEITDIDAELALCDRPAMRIELTRQRRHLASEVAAGRRLPLADTDEVNDKEIFADAKKVKRL